MNNSMSIRRIGLLYKQYYFLNGNKLLLILIATAGLIAGYHTIVHAVNYRYLEQSNFLTDYHYSSLSIAFLAACLLWSGNAFPDFRNKTKRLGYLVIPATTLEKFIFEFMIRIVIFILVFPIIYWVFTNLVTSAFHAFNPDYLNYTFSYKNPYPGELDTLSIFLMCSLALLVPTLAFTGASYFQKLPVIKTVVLVCILVGFFAGYIFFVVEILNLDEYKPKNNRILFMRNADDAKIAGIAAAIIVNITLLVFSYFKVKEKEA